MPTFTRRPAPLVGVVAATATVAALALTACSGGTSKSSTTTNAANSSITISGNSGTMVENWNPFLPAQLGGTEGILYQALFYYNLATGAAPQPMLATAATWNSDGTQLKITTRDGVRWSDGQPF